MFKRVLKTLGALGAGHGIQTLTQLLVPPAFIAAYGVKGYGEWLVLSAAVGYLGTLDFGLQTYVLNELTALYHREEMNRFHRVQSVGLWLMLCFVGGGALLACGAFVLPLGRLLKVSGPESGLSLAVFCLALQILLSIPFGQVLGIYRTFGQAHRGVMWGNLHRSLLLVLTLGLAWLHAPFWLIAAGQVLTALGILVAVILCLRLFKPEVCPRLDYWDGRMAGQILKPSAFFGLFMLNNFLVYQAPILLLQRFVGSEVVVVFSVARTLFSFVRQGAALVLQGIAPEITRLNGMGDQDRLVQLYLLFERVLLAVVLVVNAAVLLLAPSLLRLWLQRPELFELKTFIGVMVVSIVSSLKEYKIYFLYTTNNHVKTGLMTFLSYVAMITVSVPAIARFGLEGFVAAWFLIELIQAGILHLYNTQFFAGRQEISIQPAFRLGLALVVVVLLATSVRALLRSTNYLLQGSIALIAVAALSGVAYFLFGFGEVLQEWNKQVSRIRNRPGVV